MSEPVSDLNEACALVEAALVAVAANPRVRAAWQVIVETLRNEF